MCAGNTVYFNRWIESVKGFRCGLLKLDFEHIRVKTVLIGFTKKSFSCNSVIKMLLQTAVSGRYCQLFMNKVDADISQLQALFLMS